jgi:hypothetical protein
LECEAVHDLGYKTNPSRIGDPAGIYGDLAKWEISCKMDCVAEAIKNLVIFHSYVSLPEGNGKIRKNKMDDSRVFSPFFLWKPYGNLMETLWKPPNDKHELSICIVIHPILIINMRTWLSILLPIVPSSSIFLVKWTKTYKNQPNET